MARTSRQRISMWKTVEVRYEMTFWGCCNNTEAESLSKNRSRWSWVCWVGSRPCLEKKKIWFFKCMLFYNFDLFSEGNTGSDFSVILSSVYWMPHSNASFYSIGIEVFTKFQHFSNFDIDYLTKEPSAHWEKMMQGNWKPTMCFPQEKHQMNRWILSIYCVCVCVFEQTPDKFFCTLWNSKAFL